MASSRPVSTSRLSTVAKLQGALRQWRQQGRWKLLVAGIWLLGTAATTAADGHLARFWQWQAQTLFFELRGPIAASDDIVVLAIDQESLSQAQYYGDTLEQNPDLEVIQQFPWQRRAYAIAIERLLAAGARAVAIDLLFTTPSTYGPADDAALAATLERHGERVVLATTYGDTGADQGILLQPTLPVEELRQPAVHLGTINMLLEEDNRIHRFGSTYLTLLRQQSEDLDATSELRDLNRFTSFAMATLEAAGVDYPKPQGAYINFRGPEGTFEQLPFWYVLDRDPWQNQLDGGAYFRDKIVLIGPTASSLQDFHRAPFSETLRHRSSLSGVEIQANAIATLASGDAIREALPWAPLRGGLVLVLGGGFGLLLWRFQRPTQRLVWTIAVSGLWLGLSFGLFTQGLMLPVAMPIVALGGIGIAYIVTDIVTEQIRKQRLRNTLAQYATSPIVQEIISQQDDFHDLLREREAEVIGMIIGSRYRIVKLLGSGGFGETYVAEDSQLPGSPICVVKQLKIISDDPAAHALARRLFEAEAETLQQLGHHPQIPRLLASFVEGVSFYLVEEMIEGHLLRDEFASRKPLPQPYALKLLLDLLPVIGFVHDRGVIHRDIKPANVIRRHSDQRLVLIDFGAVKQISNRLTDTRAQVTSTIGIGTQGYMPSEQSAGMPGFYSDLYAIGITVIEALTGVPAYALKRDSRGELIWQHMAPGLAPAFAAILDRMVRYDFNLRYASTWAALEDVEQIRPAILGDADDKLPGYDPSEILQARFADEDEDLFEGSTQVLPEGWQEAVEAEPVSPTAPTEDFSGGSSAP